MLKRRRKPRRRGGRLEAAGIELVRREVFNRSKGFCEMRAYLIAQLNKQVMAGKISYTHAQDQMREVLMKCRGKITWETMQLAHKKSRGASGADTVDNTLASCDCCHELQHRGIKPCPRKSASPRGESVLGVRK